MRKRFFALIFMFTWITCVPVELVRCQKSFAQLFGDTNEKRWSPRGRLPDWSYAGYYARLSRPRPKTSTVFNVKDYGAKGNGKNDDSGAIQSAINDAGKPRSSNNGIVSGGIVYLPKGRYLLEARIRVNVSNVVLRGAGKDKTIIYAKRSLSYYDNYKVWLPKFVLFVDGIASVHVITRNNLEKAEFLTYDFKALLINVVEDGKESRFSWKDGFIGLGQVKRDKENTGFNKETHLATITGFKNRGYRTIEVDSTAKMHQYQWVRLFISDDGKQPVRYSLASELYGGYIEKSTCGSECMSDLQGLDSDGLNTKGKDLVRWISRIESIKGNKVVLERPLPLRIRSRWKASLHAIPEQTVQHSAIESLSIQFKFTKKKPHRQEAGFNAIAITDVVNCWVKNIEIVNADNGIIAHRSHFVTIEGILIRMAKSRAGKDARSGHIGIGLSECADFEVTKFNIQAIHWHDISVRGTMMCVFHSGKGVDLTIDSHRSAPYATLYSNIDLGKGTRPYITGGMTTRGFPAGQFTTYYNLVRTKSKANRYTPIELPDDTVQGKCSWGYKLNFRGRFGENNCKGYHVYDKDLPAKPSNLFRAQVSARHKSA